MTQFQTLTLPAHRVILSGQVSNAATLAPIARARVDLIEVPEAFTRWLAARALKYGDKWDALEERPDRARTAADGTFFFLDLPPGDYTLQASLASAGQRLGAYTLQATVPERSAQTAPVSVDLLLPPTALSGSVRLGGPDGIETPIPLAKIRLDGSGEQVFSDADGNFLLHSIEPGDRVVRISAQGYEGFSQTLSLAAAQTQTLDVLLTAHHST